VKWASITIAYNEGTRIRQALQNRLEAGYEENLVMLSEKPFYGNEYPKDKTEEIAKEMGAEVIKGVWPQDDPMLNVGLNVLKGFDYVLFLAPDEFLTKEGHRRLREFVEGDRNYSAYAISKMNTYFKTDQWRIEPREEYHPIVVIDPNKAQYRDIRSVTCDYGYLPDDITLYHYSWARTDEEVRRKIENFSHAPQMIPNWYKDHWENWTHESKDFHPTHPPQYHSVVFDPPPEKFL